MLGPIHPAGADPAHQLRSRDAPGTWDLQLISISCCSSGQMAPGTRQRNQAQCQPAKGRRLPASLSPLALPSQALAPEGFWDRICTRGSLFLPGLRGLNTIKRPSSDAGTHACSPPSLLRRGPGPARDQGPTKGSVSMTKRTRCFPQNKWHQIGRALWKTASLASRSFFFLNFPIRSSRCHINYLNLGEISAASSEALFRARRPRIPR